MIQRLLLTISLSLVIIVSVGQSPVVTFLSSINTGDVAEIEDDTLRCFLVGGQSTADGRNILDDAPSWLDPDNPVLNGFYMFDRNAEQFTPYKVGVNNGANIQTTLYWTFDLVFARNLLYHNKVTSVFAVKRTMGGTPLYINESITKGTWNVEFDSIPVTISTKLAEEFAEVISDAQTYADGLGKHLKIVCWIWKQGESDFSPEEAENEYEDNFTDLIDYIRTQVGDANLPIICGTIPDGSTQYSAAVNTAINNVAAADANCFVIDCSEYTLQDDNLHMDADAVIVFGNEMYEIAKNFDW